MIIEARDLLKKFASNTAVGGVSFSIAEGESVGLLGPNGAGKSTTLSMLLALVSPDQGSVSLFNEDTRSVSREAKRSIGFVPQELAFFPDLSGIVNVTYWGRLYGLRGKELDDAVKESLEFTGLWDRRKELAKKYSGGMQRRLNISCGIVHKPKVLIMDEPTAGVDPQSRNHILESVRTLGKNGSTIIYTSHYMEEIQTLCDRVIIMDKGRVVTDGALDDVLNSNADVKVIVLDFKSGDEARSAAQEITFENIVDVESVLASGKQVTIHASKESSFSDLARIFLGMNINLLSIREERPTLETVFLGLTGKTLRD